jgi:uncharacterized protein
VLRLLLLLSLFTFSENTFSQKVVKRNIVKKTARKSNSSKHSKIPETPIGYTNDCEKLLTKNQIDFLDSIISNFDKETSIQIAIISISKKYTTKENFDSSILATHNTWGVGKIILNNGILIGISSELRKIRISNGDGVREKLTDEKTKIIIDEIMIPEFKKNNYYLGLLKGLTEIINTLR